MTIFIQWGFWDPFQGFGDEISGLSTHSQTLETLRVRKLGGSSSTTFHFHFVKGFKVVVLAMQIVFFHFEVEPQYYIHENLARDNAIVRKMYGIILYHIMLCCDEHRVWISIIFFLLIFHNFVHVCCCGCEGFTHPLGREEKSKVKGLFGLENVLRTLEYVLHCMP